MLVFDNDRSAPDSLARFVGPRLKNFATSKNLLESSFGSRLVGTSQK